MKKKIFIIGGIILTLILGSLLAYKLTSPKKLGLSVVTDYQKTLRISMTAAQDYVPVTSLTLKDGTVLDMTKFGDKVFLTIEPGKDKEEIVMCTGISTSSLNFTGCTRGLAFSGTSTAAVSGLAKTHSAGSNVTISNVHYIYDQFVSRFGNQLIFGDQSSTTDKIIIFDDGTATSTAIKWDYATNQLLFRRMGDADYRVMPTQLRGTYDDYASLPSSGNSEGDIAITTDDSKLYVWDDSGSTWVLAGGSSGAGTMYKTELLGSESDGGDLKTFSLTSGSWPDEKFLLVYKNGQAQRIGASYDYTEVDSDTIEFTYELAADDLVQMIVVSIDLYNPAWTNVTEDIIPDTDNAHDLGSLTKTWKAIYTKLATAWNWATTTPTAGYVPIASTSNRLDDGWQNISYANATILTGGTTTSLHLHNPFAVVSAASSSATLLNSNNTETSTVASSYTLLKTTRVLLGGYYNIYFEVKGNANGLGYGRIYREGVALGTERSGNLSYLGYEESLLFLPGDSIQIYAKGDGDSTAYIQNFRLYGTLQTTSTFGFNF